MGVALDKRGTPNGVGVGKRDLAYWLAMNILAAQRKNQRRVALHIGGKEEQRASGRILVGAQNLVGMAHWMPKQSRTIAVGKSKKPIGSANNSKSS